MKRMYGYIRVSTTKQGDGVSLEEQKLAIIRYARDNGLKIVEWFEETSSASKGHRKEFQEMLRKLKRKSAEGVVIHKIDRGSRNLQDWSEISLLSDKGIDVRFAHDNVDLNTRSSRLLADMQAVIAIDYSRNLSEEAKKGLYGRLRQGVYPFQAPVGYLNTGKGGIKQIDPVKAPLVVKLFKLYATGEYSQSALIEKAKELGLTNKNNKPLCRNGIHRILTNPFYMGVIKMKTSGETFQGKHTPLITTTLFEKVQNCLTLKANPKERKHTAIYKGLIRCDNCDYVMTGELQKGRFYYRCHQRDCATKTIREDAVHKSIVTVLEPIELTEEAQEWFFNCIDTYAERTNDKSKELIKSSKLTLGKLESKVTRMTDLLIDGVLSQELYTQKKETVDIQIQTEQQKITNLSQKSGDFSTELKKIFELLFSANIKGFERVEANKRDYVKKVTSNLKVNGKTAMVELKKPFELLLKTTNGFQCWDIHAMIRTFSDHAVNCRDEECRADIDELLENLYEEIADGLNQSP